MHLCFKVSVNINLFAIHQDTHIVITLISKIHLVEARSVMLTDVC